MNIVTHVLKKDLRRTRVMLAIWLALLALQFALIGSAYKPRDNQMQTFYENIRVIVPLLQALVLIVIVPLVIHEEPLVGTTAFWLTRPISRAALLRSKSLFVLLVLILPPLLAEMTVLAANGASAHYLALAIPEILLGNLTLIACTAFVAAVTPSFGRFAVLGIALLVGVALLQVALDWLNIVAHLDLNRPGIEDSISLINCRWVVSDAIMIGGGAALLANQYLTRRTFLTFGGAGATALLVLLVCNFWNVDFLKPRTAMAGDPNLAVSAIQVSLTGIFSTTEDPSGSEDEGPARSVNAQIQLSGIPDGYVVKNTYVACTPTLADGRQLNRGPASIVYSFPANASIFTPDYDALKPALGGFSAPAPNGYTKNGGGNGFRTVSLFGWNADLYSRYATVPLKFTAKINFMAAKYIVSAEMPLAQGARYDRGVEHGVVTSILHEPNGVDITLRESVFNLQFSLDDDINNFISRGASYSGLSEQRIVYLLVNRQRREAVAQSPSVSFYGIDRSKGRLQNHSVRVSFQQPQDSLQSSILTPAWLADATLVRMELTPVASFQKEVAASKLILEGSNKILVPAN